MRHLLRLLLVAFLAVALVRAGAFAVYAYHEVDSPTEAYHLEAKSSHLAWRAQHGRTLYPAWEDGPAHVTNFFGPLYFLAVGGVARLLDADIDGMVRIGRLMTIGSGLLAAAVVALASGRREGPFAGLFAGSLAIGSAPMIGFGAMVRPDAMADLLGIAGFLTASGGVGGAPSRRRLALGGALLVAAVFAKQTAALYLLAAVLALAISGSRRLAAALAAGSAAASAAIVAVVTIAVEPRFAVDLLGEAGTPSSLRNWRATLWRLWILSRELPLLAVLGFGLWTLRGRRDLPWLALMAAILIACSAAVVIGLEGEGPILTAVVAATPIAVVGVWAAIDPRRPRDVALATLAAVQLIGSAASATKLGADLNYFLGLRLVAALAGGAIWGATQRFCSAPPEGEAFPRRSRAARGAAVGVGVGLLAYAMLAGLYHTTEQMMAARRLARFAGGPGRPALALRQEVFDRAADPGSNILSDSGLVQLHQGDRAAFVDPWLFRVMVTTGRIDPAGILRRIEAEEYELIVTTKDLFDVRDPYDTYEFGLPPVLAEAARRHYRRAGIAGGLFVFVPRGEGG